jgi:hypothetical protein
MTDLVRTAALCAAVVACTGGIAVAQGVQTGTLRGTVRGANGASQPGVEVRVTSPALQGMRTATTGSDGTYVVADLPPGEYEAEFRLAGAEILRQRTEIRLGGTSVVDVRLQLNGRQTVVFVTAPELVTPEVNSNHKYEDVDALPMLRTPASITRFAPGVSDAVQTPGPTEGQGQAIISGSFGYDNVFMLNGVDIGDNIFGWPQNLFIEDAIVETQILIAGIPAEYGRFGGGVANAITKSGGNQFSGSYRLNLANRAWGTETPFEVSNGVSRASNVNFVHEATFGGPIKRDRLWFFTAGRVASVETSETLNVTGVPYVTTDRNLRGELKLTATLAEGHVLHGSAIGNPRQQENQANFRGALSTVDPFALSDKERPNHLLGVTYRGVLRTQVLVDAQYSQQQFQTDAGGGTSTSLLDSPFLTLTFLEQYNAPYFDAGDPDRRNNRQLTGSVSYFRRGHELKAGYEFFRSQKIGGNSPSSTGYVFQADYLTDAAGDPVLDSGGRFIPIFEPGNSYILRYEATRGATLNLDHNSAYVQDRWMVSENVTLHLGVRLEHVSSDASGASESVDATTTVPRLGASYDPTGSGKYVIRGSYSRYSGRYSDALFLSNSSVGNPNEVDGVYVGQPGQGLGFGAGFDPGNYDFNGIFASYPTANVHFDPDLSSPLTDEFTVSVGTDLRRRGALTASYIWRSTDDLVEDFISLANGTTQVESTDVDLTLTNRVYANTDLAGRDYQALLFQGRYELQPGWTVDGHWTVQLENEGNYEGEAPNRIVTSQLGDYPEIFTESRHYPTGRLSSFQRHKVHVWSIYALDFGRAGRGAVAGLWRYNSARTYTLRGILNGVTGTQGAILDTLGYPDAPATQQLYFSLPGSEPFAGYGIFDLSGSYDVPVFRGLRPRLDVEVFNLFDNQKLIGWNTTIVPVGAPGAPVDNLGLPTTYIQGPFFRQGRSESHYPVPLAGETGGRTFRVSFGVRF